MTNDQSDSSEQQDSTNSTGVEVQTSTIRELLTGKELTVPDYQRPYTWTPDNVRQLISDIKLFSRSYDEYRIGTVIMHEEDKTHNLVDGQQRTVTFAILLNALQNRFKISEDKKISAHLQIVSNPSTVSNIQANEQAVERAINNWDDTYAQQFYDYLLDHCKVLIVTVHELSEAFQMFDSQNARGKALDPTDLLKAFHIRQMEQDGVTHAREYELVRQWEQIPPVGLHYLFNAFLYRAKQWSHGVSIREYGFTAAQIPLFEGVSISQENPANNWSKVYLLARQCVNNYKRDNGVLERSKVASQLEYPFQIDQPVVNGETFFEFTEHYYQLARNLGLWGEPTLELNETSGEIFDFMQTKASTNWRYRQVKDLFFCELLYYVDRFGEQCLNEAIRLFFLYAARLRLLLRSLGFASVNSYALALSTRYDGNQRMFEIIRNAKAPEDVLGISLDERIEDIPRNEDLLQLYKKITDSSHGTSSDGDREYGAPFQGVQNRDQLADRLRDLAKQGITDRWMLFQLLEQKHVTRHESKSWHWYSDGLFEFTRKDDILKWISSAIQPVIASANSESDNNDGDAQ